MSRLQRAARAAAMDILEASANKRVWTSYEKLQFTMAFNALQRLAGKKILMTREMKLEPRG